MTNRKRIIVVDDHDLFREGLVVLLNRLKTVEVVAEARNGKEFLEIVNKHNPDVVLMDINMPVMDGIITARESMSVRPDLKILVLSMFGDEENYFRMVNAGVKGFILKSAGLTELEKAILEVSENGNYFSNELLRKIITNINDQVHKAEAREQSVSSLTRREKEILKLVVAGFSNEDIVNKLNISMATVKSHRSSLLSKTSCANSAGLVMFAIKHKIVEVQ